MAEVVLNLKYNDNGAEGKINSIIKALQQAEAKDWKLKVNIDEAAVNHQFANIQRTGAAAIQGLKRAWSDYKSIVEAPLNLTGVNQLVSLLDKMEGSLLLNQISSNITSGFANSLERYDILQTYPKIIESIGYSSKDASDSMDRLYKSVLGLPTAFGDIVNSAQYFTLILDDLEKGTDLAIAANNAFVASGATGQQVTAGMRQLQYIMEGTKLRSTQWYSLIRSMPIALREVGDALGYPDFKSFTEDLIANKVASEDFIDTLIDVGLNSDKLGNLLDTMKDRAVAALTNVRNAAMRMGEGWLTTLDKTLEKTGGKGLEDNIKGVSSIIDHIAEVGRTWIETHGTELQSLIDKFMAIKWDELVPKLFDSLTNIADTALGNIDEWLLKIPDILQDVRATFNAIDNSRLLKILEVLGTGVTTGATAGILAKLFGGAALFGGGSAAVAATGAAATGATAAGATAAGVASSAFGALGGGIVLTSIVAAVVEEINRSQTREKISEDTTNFLANNPRALYLARLLNSAYGSYDGISFPLSQEYRNKLSSQEQYNYALSELKRLYPNIVLDTVREIRKDGVDTFYRVLFDEDEIAKILGQNVQIDGKTIDDILKERSQIDMLAGEYPSAYNEQYLFEQAALEHYDKLLLLQRVFEAAVSTYQSRLSEIDSRRAHIQAAIEELQKKGVSLEYKTISDYTGIYGDPKGKEGKFFSERIKDSFGGLFRNTLNDFGKVQRDLTPKIKDLNDKMISAITNYDGNEEEKDKLFEAWANTLSGIDPNDPSSISQLETMIVEGPSKMIETYLIPSIRSNEALNKNKQLLYDAMMQALGLAGEDLDSQKEQVYEDMAKDNLVTKFYQMLDDKANEFESTFLPGIRAGLTNFKDSVIREIRSAVDDINDLRLNAFPQVNVYIRRKVVSDTYNSYLLGQGSYSASGGFMSPKGTDVIPAMLTPGEYVQRRAAVQHFGRTFMDRINALDLNGALNAFYSNPYATGGFVRSDNRSYRDNHAVVNQVFNSGNASTGFRRASRFVRALG